MGQDVCSKSFLWKSWVGNKLRNVAWDGDPEIGNLPHSVNSKATSVTSTKIASPIVGLSESEQVHESVMLTTAFAVRFQSGLNDYNRWGDL